MSQWTLHSSVFWWAEHAASLRTSAPDTPSTRLLVSWRTPRDPALEASFRLTVLDLSRFHRWTGSALDSAFVAMASFADLISPYLAAIRRCRRARWCGRRAV
jgi:hypothetical protein